MLAIIMTVLNLIPGLSSLATGWVTAAYNSKVAITTARIGGDTSVATAMVHAQAVAEDARVKGLQVISGSKALLFLTVGFALPYMLYEWQCVVYDKLWMHGTTATDALGGDLSSWAATIIGCLFGSNTLLAVGHMYFNRKDQ